MRYSLEFLLLSLFIQQIHSKDYLLHFHYWKEDFWHFIIPLAIDQYLIEVILCYFITILTQFTDFPDHFLDFRENLSTDNSLTILMLYLPEFVLLSLFIQQIRFKDYLLHFDYWKEHSECFIITLLIEVYILTFR